jgi:hypothetical protein
MSRSNVARIRIVYVTLLGAVGGFSLIFAARQISHDTLVLTLLEHTGSAIVTAAILGMTYEIFLRENEFLRIDHANVAVRHDVTLSPEQPADIASGTLPKPVVPSDATHDFAIYYAVAVDQIVRKANTADEKASVLLTKGIRYSQLGILLYIIAILTWQIVERYYAGTTPSSTPLHAATILGVTSTTVLFIFIEFLAAWFLKQYRHFVDTSTYLMKVKSILDRYMLTYLLVKDRPDETKYSELLALLARDINWPDRVTADGSYASDAMSSLAALLASLRTKAESKEKGARVE